MNRDDSSRFDLEFERAQRRSLTEMVFEGSPAWIAWLDRRAQTSGVRAGRRCSLELPPC
jgi:hypothetical protein